MYLNFINNKLVDGPRSLPNCYECISNFDCLEKNDPEALKNLSKYGLPGHKWLKGIELSEALRPEFYEKHDPKDIEYAIVNDVAYFKFKKITPSKEEILTRLRADRNQKLSSTDWTQLPDAEISNEEKERYIKYRKALRNLPNEYLKYNRLEWPIL
jgi:hypothetical protein